MRPIIFVFENILLLCLPARRISWLGLRIIPLGLSVLAAAALPSFAQNNERDASDIPGVSKGDLQFYIDTSEYRGAHRWARREIYLLIDVQQLWPGDETVGELHLKAAVRDTADTVVLERIWTRRVSRDDREGRGTHTAPYKEAISLDLQPGTYRYRLEIQNHYTSKTGVFDGTFIVRNYEREGLVFSDLQFASDLVRTPEMGPFIRQGWKVTPNTTRHHLAGESLKVYFELYNLGVGGAATEDSFILGYSLRDSLDVVVRTFPAKRFLKPGESVVKAEFLQTEDLQEGTYTFQVEAFDGSTRQYVRSRRTLFVVSGGPEISMAQGQRDLMTYYADIRYVADEATLTDYRAQRTVEDQADFLRTFWKSLDPSPDSATNERLLEHVLRMSEANGRFGAGSRRKGIDTDRGRVLVHYGPPDDIVYNTSAAGRRPYEVWVYEAERRYEFVFRDRRGVGVYELIHSTYPGELQNPYWAQEF